MLNPTFLKTDLFSNDVKERVKLMNQTFESPIGAYTHSKGLSQIRQAVANFIEERDGSEVHCDWTNIYLCNGASEGANLVFKVLIRGELDGALVPVPLYPMYRAFL